MNSNWNYHSAPPLGFYDIHPREGYIEELRKGEKKRGRVPKMGRNRYKKRDFCASSLHLDHINHPITIRRLITRHARIKRTRSVGVIISLSRKRLIGYTPVSDSILSSIFRTVNGVNSPSNAI